MTSVEPCVLGVFVGQHKRRALVDDLVLLALVDGTFKDLEPIDEVMGDQLDDLRGIWCGSRNLIDGHEAL